MKFYPRRLLFAAALLALLSCETQMQNSSAYYSASDSVIDIKARVHWQGDSLAAFAWSGSSVSFRVQTDSLKLLMSHDSTGAGEKGPLKDFYAIFLDGELLEPEHYEVDEEAITLGGLGAVPRNFELVRRVEGSFGMSQFAGLELSLGGKLLPSENRLSRKIEFIGNSITCGYGNEGNSPDCDFSAATENAYLSYAMIAARDLQAEPRLVAYSGRGLIRNYSGKEAELMPELWHYVNPTEPKRAYDPKIWVPDLVHINLGTNDFSTGHIPDEKEWTEAYLAFLEDIHRHYGDSVPVICAIGTVMYGEALETIRGYLQSITESWNAKGRSTAFFYLYTAEEGRNQGCDYHPNAENHRLMANELVAYIREEVKPDW